MRKTYILDTNVLIHDPLSFTKFEDNTVIIPIAVIEELDTFKNYSDEKGKNVRIASRKLDELRSFGRLDKGVKTSDGGLVKVLLDGKDDLLKNLTGNQMDNRILAAAYAISKKEENVVLVTKDINLRLKAEAIGLKAEDYESGKVNIDELYSGVTVLSASSAFVDAIYKQKVADNPVEEKIPNEFLIVHSNEDNKKTVMARTDFQNPSKIRLVSADHSPWGIKPLNKEQRFAMELLLDENIKLVTLLGTAGTGKTLVSLACGLQKSVDENVYRRLIICRSVIPVGKDIGYLPGTKEEKLATWMGAIYDNLEFIMDKRHQDDAASKFEYLLQQEKLEIASVTHIRGRSLPKQYMIVDDAQNLTPHEIKTILSRAGEGTKVVVTGDPYQIDNPYLDVASNGLTYIVDRFKGQKIYGHLTFTKTERSELAALVSELM